MEDQELVQDQSGIIDVQHRLISSRRVEGTTVFDKSGKKRGVIHSLMIGKRDGKVAYAVMEMGGFLGIGETVYPVPWELLTYDVNLDGYVVDITDDKIEKAPTLTLDQTDRPFELKTLEQISDYWGVMPWWGL